MNRTQRDRKLYKQEEKRHEGIIKREDKRHEKAHLIEEKRAEERGAQHALHRLNARHGFQTHDPRRDHELEHYK
jgi:hypothetical protein